jgi:hypothetical protein
MTDFTAGAAVAGAAVAGAVVAWGADVATGAAAGVVLGPQAVNPITVIIMIAKTIDNFLFIFLLLFGFLMFIH